ncbi:hypothetical protein HYQ45_016673 [Verticillium longisporum]|uniref:Uncharacterized protein n=1 Tax=Verticillium longisporum TaxID=100787 RepID=A0A8I2Z7X2_VERLO|nr:hypothetical protein HYQ45_016673 [Verticillium longisporum]KAG7152785.1 hypothetical protein HYQ46_005492 [Verticillium longisporum]
MTLKIVAASVGLGPSFQKPVFYLVAFLVLGFVCSIAPLVYLYECIARAASKGAKGEGSQEDEETLRQEHDPRGTPSASDVSLAASV